MAKVYIVHGYTASIEKHWFPWLAEKLNEKGIECHRVVMPNADNPTPEGWLNALREQVQIDSETIVVGHSLGCIAWLNFLSRYYEQPAGAVFVSGFYQPLETLPQLAAFSNVYAVSPPLMPFKSYVVAALNDNVVPHQYSDDLAKHLQADYIRLPKGEHFCEQQGCTSLPIVLELIEKLLQK